MLWRLIKSIFNRTGHDAPIVAADSTPKEPAKKTKISQMAMINASIEPKSKYDYEVKVPSILPGVVPKGEQAPVLAMDYTAYDFASSVFQGGGFPGFQYLSQLDTRAEYQAFSNKLSSELTRKWIKLTSSENSGDSTAEKIRLIEAEAKRLNIRGVFQTACKHDIKFGRAQFFLNIDGQDAKNPLILSPKTVKKGSFRGVSAVEAVWTTPNAYNAIDPTTPDFFKPIGWFMLGKQVHSTRLLTVITRELPDILKPAFNFAGMSLYQLAEPYVDNWLRTRQSVADLINNFSTTALATAMDQILQGGDDGQSLLDRATFFTATRSNKGLMLLDKEREELVQINTPLSGLHELQAQAQEHLCSVSSIPAMVLTGISPSGLNASSDGEIRVFYDWINAQQEAYWRSPLEIIYKLIQLSLFGEIDDDIGIEFVPLYQMTPEQEAEIRLKNSQTATAYVGAGIIDPSEERERLARDPHSGYDGLDTDSIPVAPNDPSNEVDPLYEAQDKSVSEAQHKAMEAAAHGHGTLGIPEEVGKEYVAKDS